MIEKRKKGHSLKLVTLGLWIIIHVIATNILTIDVGMWNKKELFSVSSLF